MKITGYSERGIVNALFYDMLRKKFPELLLEKFIRTIQFPFIKRPEFLIENVEIFIEQSFSDFGDADVLILISTETSKESIFIEAKVNTCSSTVWKIDGEYDKFLNGVKEERVCSSNIFVQLYHKVRMVNELRSSKGLSALQSGIKFPKCSSKETRKIGENQIVLKAVEKLKNYLDRTYYVAILPDSSKNMYRFFKNKFTGYNFQNFEKQDIHDYGYISWADVEEFCLDNNLRDTLRVFKFNEGQIYSKS